VRASTPTHAAQLLAQEQQAFVDQIHELVEGVVDGMRGYLETQVSELEGLAHRLRLLHPRHQLQDYTQRGLQAQTRLVQMIGHALEREERLLQALSGRLGALSPLAVLGRGYSITFRLPSRAVVTDARTLHVGDEIETLLANGRLTSRVTDTALTTLDADAADA
jgi:exodeoxyribonuclease VII large subunit